MNTPIQPLDGITVLSFEHAIAAPFASRQLAELGARVIKIERPGVGDFARNYDERVEGLASHFVWTNRSKESLTLDLKHPDAKDILAKLFEQADVILQNLAPGAASRLGLGWDEIHAQHPEMIVCDISGYGSDGPHMQRKAYDLLIQAEAGFLSITGGEEAPAKAGISIADIAAGMYAYTNILAAIIQRGKTGQGSHIDVSMLEAMAEWMSFPMYYALDGQSPPPRSGSDHATIFPYGVFETADGNSTFVAIQNEREWARFCADVLERKELAGDGRFSQNSKRRDNREELTAIIADALGQISHTHLAERLEKAQIANAAMNDMAGLWNHPQLTARGRWSEVDSPAGAIPALIPPGGLSGVEAEMGAIPALGQHSEAILGELGYSAADIARLSESGAV
ncbi:MAG: CaiB/BaiF CoA-transferase family protein [Erythrobacter sp.]